MTHTKKHPRVAPAAQRLGRALAIAMFAVCAVLAVVTVYWRMPTTFEVQATTERVTAHVNSPSLRWQFRHASITSAAHAAIASFDGSVELPNGGYVDVRRISDGPLLIDIKPLTSQHIRATGLDDNAIQTYDDRITIRVDSVAGAIRESVLMPFVGEVKVGTDIGFDQGIAPALLREGTVTRYGKSLFTHSHFAEGSSPLQLGDVVDLPDDHSAHAPAGIISVNDKPGLNVVFRVVTRELTVSRFESGSYTLGTSLRDRLANDDSLHHVWITCAFLWGLGSLLLRWRSE